METHKYFKKLSTNSYFKNVKHRENQLVTVSSIMFYSTFSPVRGESHDIPAFFSPSYPGSQLIHPKPFTFVKGNAPALSWNAPDCTA